jgi:hypothetical protein
VNRDRRAEIAAVTATAARPPVEAILYLL